MILVHDHDGIVEKPFRDCLQCNRALVFVVRPGLYQIVSCVFAAIPDPSALLPRRGTLGPLLPKLFSKRLKQGKIQSAV